MTAPPWNPNPDRSETHEGSLVEPDWRCFVMVSPEGVIQHVWLGPYKRALPRLLELLQESRSDWRELKEHPERFRMAAGNRLERRP